MKQELKQVKHNKKGFRKIIKKFWPLYIMMLPGMIYIMINNYIPMLGLTIAFKKINYTIGIMKSPWVGLSNFTYLFKTSDAWNITRNTIGYNLLFILLGTVISITVAVLLNEVK
jgi:putative aldouronate transport system permease protein